MDASYWRDSQLQSSAEWRVPAGDGVSHHRGDSTLLHTGVHCTLNHSSHFYAIMMSFFLKMDVIDSLRWSNFLWTKLSRMVVEV